MNFLNLEWNDQLKEFYKTAEKRGIINTPSYNQINQPLYKNSINRWKNYEIKLEDIKPMIQFTDGVCSACIWEKEKSNIKWNERRNELELLCDKFSKL